MAFSLLIKPASSDCNLRCRYCYYGQKKDSISQGRIPQSSSGMSDTVLEKVIQSYMQTEQDIYSMVWHGGEPTLMPVSFFEQAIALQKQYAVKGARISNSIQTNATIISDNLASFMARYRFLCGVSLDGPPDIHNLYRKTSTGKNTHAWALNGIASLQKRGVPVNILVLVSQANVRKPLEVYRYLKKKGFTHIQFIPCLEYDKNGQPLEHSISGEEWGDFLVAVFNEWFRYDLTIFSIRIFESILAKLVYNTAIDCYNSDRCNRYLVVEQDGGVYPCDFFVEKEYLLGNLLEDSFEDIIGSTTYRQFYGKKVRWHTECDTCEFQNLCMGDCLKFRMCGNMQAHTLSPLCRGWKTFYEQTLSRFHSLSKHLMSSKS